MKRDYDGPLSVDPAAPGHDDLKRLHEEGWKVSVFVDGCKVPKATSADPARGVVTAFETEEGGRFGYRWVATEDGRQTISQVELHGNVRIELERRS